MYIICRPSKIVYVIVLHDQLIIYMGVQLNVNQNRCNQTFEASIDSALKIKRTEQKETLVCCVNKKLQRWLRNTFCSARPHMHEKIEYSFRQMTKIYSKDIPECMWKWTSLCCRLIVRLFSPKPGADFHHCLHNILRENLAEECPWKELEGVYIRTISGLASLPSPLNSVCAVLPHKTHDNQFLCSVTWQKEDGPCL